MSLVPSDTLSLHGVYVDPLWRVTVELTPLERELLRTWWVRRLGFIAHAGASCIATNQTYSRLEHSLGLLSLVANFAPDDHVSRAAAHVHDIGHLPFSHTFEGIEGLNHHTIGSTRIHELGDLFHRHGIDAALIVDVVDGRRPSTLHAAAGLLKLDHLDSFVRSGRAHGRTHQSPPMTLSRLRILDGAVDTDAETASYLHNLIAGEALFHLSAINVVTTGLMRNLAVAAMTNMTESERDTVAESTDDQFWALLMGDPETSVLATELRRDPGAWIVEQLQPGADHNPDLPAGHFRFQINRLYLDTPLVNGHRMMQPATFAPQLPQAPVRYVIRPDPVSLRAR